MANEQYLTKLRDPRWQKKRLEVLERDNWTCQLCGDKQSTLTVHHRYYTKGAEPWDYPGECLVTLCENCHEDEFEARADALHLLMSVLQKSPIYAADIYDLAHAIELINPRRPARTEVYNILLSIILVCKDQSFRNECLDSQLRAHPTLYKHLLRAYEQACPQAKDGE
jgi:hypothetical protein